MPRSAEPRGLFASHSAQINCVSGTLPREKIAARPLWFSNVRVAADKPDINNPLQSARPFRPPTDHFGCATRKKKRAVNPPRIRRAKNGVI